MFFISEMCEKEISRRMNIKKIAVIGVGTIGCGWATFFAMKGLNVSLFDTQQSTLESAISRIKDNLTFLAESNYLTQDESCSAFLRIQICRSLSEALSDADFVQESIIENYEAKKALYAEMDRLALPNVILSSSSSGLLMSEIQTAAVIHPERCVIGHPINPVFIVPLVEIVPGRQTDPRIVSSLKLFLEEIGKVPVVLKKEVPGYLENRLTAAIWREAIDLVLNDVASVEDVDKAIWAGPGLRYALMGPLLIYHIGGGEGGVRSFIRHIGAAAEEWWKDMNTWTKIPENAADILEKGIIESMHGKTIREVCDWRDHRLMDVIRAVDINAKYSLEDKGETP